jgi:thiamine biosynthesis protein ThiS
MEITINGRRRDVPAEITLAGLIARFGLDAARVVAERNRAVVGRDQYGETKLLEGDVVELVEIVGGG